MIYKLLHCLWSRKIICIVIIIFALQESAYAQSQEGVDVLRAGIAKIDITPVNPVRLRGYRSRKALSEGIHDRLYARAVVFGGNGKRLVLVSVDLTGYYDGTFEYIQKYILDEFNLEPEELFLSAIHTHSAPTLTIGKKKVYPSNLKYTEVFKQKLVTVIREALSNMTPVHVGVGIGYSPVGVNRRKMLPDGTIGLGRNPYGPTDKEVLVMKIVKPDGSLVGALFDYATHCTSLGSKNMQVSGDILGIAEQFVEKILGKGLIAPAFAGASGDIDPWFRVLPEFNTEQGWIPEPVLLGTWLGEEVVHVFRDIDKVNPGGEIKTSFRTIDCPVKKNGVSAAEKIKSVPVNITAARVGDVALVGVSVEMLTEVGMAIKAGSPYKHTFIITHCNGASGYLPFKKGEFETRSYLPPKHLYKEGGYEVKSSPFAPQAADMVVKQALKMLYGL